MKALLRSLQRLFQDAPAIGTTGPAFHPSAPPLHRPEVRTPDRPAPAHRSATPTARAQHPTVRGVPPQPTRSSAPDESTSRPADRSASRTENPVDTVAFLAYLDGRQSRWRLTLDDCIAHAGEDPRARLLAVFDALKEWAASPSGFRSCAFVHAQIELVPPEHPARTVVARHKHALRTRVRELAEATGAPDSDLLADQLLLLYEGVIAQYTVGTVHDAADRAHATARQLIAAATPYPLDAFWAGPRAS
ncbi:hypothetical protein ACFCY8_39700 [Streptomyces noursei]|uniref:hypothetical protein n=1 Tax=Streptomyces noursei TaxID=1971 RepID=UPI0035D8D418